MTSIGILMMVSMLYTSYTWAGALSATNGLAWAAGNWMLSRLIDRHGQSRIMIPALLITNLSLIWLVAAAWTRSPPWMLFIPAGLSGLAGGSPGTLVRARWSHALGDSPLLHTAFSLESTLDEITYIVGPLVVAALCTTIHPTAGLMAPVILSLSGGTWFFYGLRATQPPVRRLGDAPSAPVASLTGASGVPNLRPNRFVLAYGGMISIVVVTALFGCAFGALDVATVAATKAWGAAVMSGPVLAAMSLGSALAGLIYGSRRWKTPLPRRFLIGVTVFAVLTPLYLLAHSVPILLICGFLAGSAIAPSFTNANSLVTVLVPKHRLTEGLSWIGTSIGLGASLGNSLAGWLTDQHGYEGGYWTAVISVLISFVLALLGSRALSRNAAQRYDRTAL